jgi:hypothetical protein
MEFPPTRQRFNRLAYHPDFMLATQIPQLCMWMVLAIVSITALVCFVFMFFYPYIFIPLALLSFVFLVAVFREVVLNRIAYVPDGFIVFLEREDAAGEIVKGPHVLVLKKGEFLLRRKWEEDNVHMDLFKEHPCVAEHSLSEMQICTKPGEHCTIQFHFSYEVVDIRKLIISNTDPRTLISSAVIAKIEDLVHNNSREALTRMKMAEIAGRISSEIEAAMLEAGVSVKNIGFRVFQFTSAAI